MQKSYACEVAIHIDPDPYSNSTNWAWNVARVALDEYKWGFTIR